MTAQARAADAWHMDTGEHRSVPDEPELTDRQLAELGQQVRELTKWAEDFARQLERGTSHFREINGHIETLRDLFLSVDRKHDLTTAQVAALVSLVTDLKTYLEPERKLKEARALLEADALAKADRWRKRWHAAKPIAFLFVAGAFAFVAAWVWLKSGVNIIPLVIK